MSLEPRRTKSNRVPVHLHIRVSRSNLRAFEVVTEAGEVLATGIPDINSARVFAAAPLLLEGLYDAQWEVWSWVSRNLEEEEYAEGTKTGALLQSFEHALEAAQTPDGLYPIG
jgi:hypothetical protein